MAQFLVNWAPNPFSQALMQALKPEGLSSLQFWVMSHAYGHPLQIKKRELLPLSY